MQDNGPAWHTVWGISGERFTSADQSATSAAVIDAPGSTRFLSIVDLLISAEDALTLTFTEETTGKVKLVVPMPADSVLPWTPRGELKLAAGKRLMVQASGAGTFHVTATGRVAAA